MEVMLVLHLMCPRVKLAVNGFVGDVAQVGLVHLVEFEDCSA